MAIFSHQLALALTGELQATIDWADNAVLLAADAAVHNITQRLKGRLRDIVIESGLGKRLSGAVRAKEYPESEGTLARNPAGFIYVQPSAVHIFEAFEKPNTIEARNGRFLAIPIPGSPADRKNYGQKRKGVTTVEDFRQRGVEMQYVRAVPGRPAMLVAKMARVSTLKSGRQKVSQAGLTKTGKVKAGAQSVPLFWLVPRVKMSGRLGFEPLFKRAADEFLADFAREFDREFARFSETARLQRRAA